MSVKAKCPEINNKLQNPKQIHRASTVTHVQKMSMAAGISTLCNYCIKPRALLYKEEKLKMLKLAFYATFFKTHF